MKIKKILIANRGEIALRVIKTCKKLGIKTVTLYTEEDRYLPHASASDEAFYIGQGTLAETYLNQDKIIEIAKKTKTDAIHPGYGFLSENESFCRRLKEEGIIFIGPSVDAITLMGDKKTSKVKMEEVGIPLVPGYHGDNQDSEFLKKEADRIGYPVLIKATAGGGGKGMRIVNDTKSFITELEGAKREAKNAFGNDRVLLEKYIVNPRHIEVQVMSDSHGGHYHFFERECSIQRRYQKVIEETPSAALSDELRHEICETATKIARGINYLGAGTIEYILSQDNEFYFLEMNTRLQVEHPITEMVTGADLVELQIRVADGQKLDLLQEEIAQMGVAIECRIYSENPDRDFLPTNGVIRHIGRPHGARLDCGFRDGNEVSTQYDPMLAKIIVHGHDRDDAIMRMQESLNSLYFSGIKTNRDYLKRILNHDKYIVGDIHTHFIKDEQDFLKAMELGGAASAHAFALAFFADQKKTATNYIWQNKAVAFSKRANINGVEKTFSINSFNGKHLEFLFEGEEFIYSLVEKDQGNIALDFEGELVPGFVESQYDGNIKQIFFGDFEVEVELFGKVAGKKGLSAGANSLQSPMPGKIFKILKKEGEKVNANDPILIMEAMKMEHTICAHKDGVLTEIFFKEGEQVQGKVDLAKID